MIIERLKNILSAQGEDVSALLAILSKQEKIKLYDYFDQQSNQENDIEDIKLKFFALNALFIYIKNHPSVEDQLKEDVGEESEVLVLKIYELSDILYRSNCTWEYYFYRVSYAILANKATLLSTDDPKPEPNDSFPDQILNFFTQFAYPQKTRADLEEREHYLENLKQQFSAIQESENIRNQQQIFDIIAQSNLIDLAEEVKAYLLEGTGKDIEASINNKIVNALEVFHETGNRKWELICSLLRFVLHKLYQNSVWNYANQLPLFKDFFKEQLEKDSFIFSLFPSQKAALKEILAARKSTVISMPTSSGKTLIAELKILYTRSLYQDDCLCIYVVPTNALVNQTLRRLKTSFSGLDLNVEQLLPYNHFDSLEEGLIGKKPDILVATPEKINFLLKNQEINLLDRLRLIIIDEAHNISDPSRGSIWEFLLANLKQNDGQLSYLLLTPFIQNKEELANWLGGDISTSKSIEWTPSKQYAAYHSLHSNKSISKINYLPTPRNSIIGEEVSIDLAINLESRKQDLGENMINDVVRNSVLVEKYAKQSGCILILHRGSDSTEKLAKKLAQKFDFPPKDPTDELTYAKEVVRQELGEGNSLLDLLDRGIAFHHSKIPPLVKETIENLVLIDAIKVLVATTTLAQGMNFPIKTVIFETLTLGGGSDSRELSYSDFWNIAGRAGRAYKDTEGHVVLGHKNSNTETQKKLESYIKKDTERTISSLKEFFDQIKGNEDIDYNLIKDSSIAQNFLHYLNHLMNISYQYELDQVKRQDIINILSNSLYFKQNEFEEGFLESQEKIVNFANKYINSIKQKGKEQLKLADTLGITDISLATIIGITQNNRPLLSNCINQNKIEDLITIVDAINKIPELKISLGRDQGKFQPETVARILLSWINGESIASISQQNNLLPNECSGYIFSRLRNYIPWGMAIYQNISNDENKLLPSYAFYGVKDAESVKLSYIGVPRFALERVKQLVTDKALYENMGALKAHCKREVSLLQANDSQSSIVNKIIEKSIL